MLRSYLSEILCHKPERSGLPSAVRGAGAVRFGLPLAVRGMPGVGRFSHCASSGALSMDTMVAIANAFIDAASCGGIVSCAPSHREGGCGGCRGQVKSS